jgi:hypothetical protein
VTSEDQRRGNVAFVWAMRIACLGVAAGAVGLVLAAVDRVTAADLRTAALVAFTVAAGLVVVSLPFGIVFMRRWR